MVKYLWMFLLCAVAVPALGSEPGHPLLPSDISSPRSTLNSFMENCASAYAQLTTFDKAGIHIALPAFTTRISDESGWAVAPPLPAAGIE